MVSRQKIRLKISQQFCWARNCFAFFCLATSSALAFATANSGITYHGRILNPDGTPLTDSAVQFKMQIATPDGQTCLMYQEIQTKDLSTTSGAFSITLNDGTATPTLYGYNMDQIFGNYGSFSFSASNCVSGTGSYTPNPSDGRAFLVSFKTSTMSSFETLPTQLINFVPMAIEAKQVAGFPGSTLLRVDNGSGPTAVRSITSTEANALFDLADGISTKYVQSTGNGAPLPSFASNPSSPAAGDVWYDSTAKILKYYDGTAVQAVGSGSGSGTVTSITAGTGLSGGTITTTGTISMPNTGTAGTYTKVTTDAQGRVTSGAQITGADITSGTIGGSTAINSTGNITTTGNVVTTNLSSTTDSTINLKIFESTDTNAVTITAPAALVAGGYSLVLPPNKASVAGQVLSSDTSGNLSWLTPGLPTLADDKIWVGQSGTATAVTMSGDATMTNAGVVSVASTGASGFYKNGGNSFGTAATLGTNDSNSLSFKAAGSTVATIDTSGNLGVGTASPASKLDVIGDIGFGSASRGKLTEVGGDPMIQLKTGAIGFGVRNIAGTSTNFWVADGGNVGIGTTSPTSTLQLKAGTAAAGTAPLKFTTGTLTTTAEAGAVEYDGSSLYYTDNGGTRHALAASGSGITALTGDVSATGSGSVAATVNKVNGVSYGAAPATNTVPVVTAANTVTYEAVPNAALANSSITLGTTAVPLGSTATSLANLTSISLGTDGTTAGSLTIYDTTSGGGVKIQNPSTASTYNFNLPATAGTSGQVLLSGGGSSSPMTWGTLTVGSGGTGLSGGTQGGIPYFATPTTMASSAALTQHAVVVGGGTGGAPYTIAAGGAGTILTGQGSTADPSFSATPTLGVNGASGTTGAISLANGVASGQSTTIQPNAATTTAWTLTLPSNGGTSGYLLQTDGSGNTSWVSATASNGIVDGVTVQSQSGVTNTSCPTYTDVPGSSKSVVFSGTGSVVLSWNFGFYFSTAGGGILHMCVDSTCGGETNFYSNETSSHKLAGGTWVTSVAAGTHTIKMQTCSRSGVLASNTDDGLSWVAHTGIGTNGVAWSANGANTYYSTGNVGIGTSSPGHALALAGPSEGAANAVNLQVGQAGFVEGRTGSALLELSGGSHFNGSNWTADATTASSITLYNGDTTFYNNSGLTAGNTFTVAPTVTIKASGNVGIGTTTPAQLLDVNGTLQANQLIGGQLNGAGNLHLDAWSSGATRGIYLNWNQGTGGVFVGNGSANYGPIYASAFNVSSDRTLKTNIEPIDNALDRIQLINGVRFDWISPSASKDRQVGVIAQDVQRVFPELVQVNKDNGKLTVNYSSLVAPIIEAIKEFYAKWVSDSHEVHTELTELKGQMQQLKDENAQMKAWICSKDSSAPFCR